MTFDLHSIDILKMSINIVLSVLPCENPSIQLTSYSTCKTAAQKLVQLS